MSLRPPGRAPRPIPTTWTWLTYYGVSSYLLVLLPPRPVPPAQPVRPQPKLVIVLVRVRVSVRGRVRVRVRVRVRAANLVVVVVGRAQRGRRGRRGGAPEPLGPWRRRVSPGYVLLVRVRVRVRVWSLAPPPPRATCGTRDSRSTGAHARTRHNPAAAEQRDLSSRGSGFRAGY